MTYLNWKPELGLAFLNRQLNKLEIGERLIIDGLPDEIYHASEGISSSMIKRYIDCPMKYRNDYIDAPIDDDEPSKSHFDYGKALHTIMLESHLFDRNFVTQSRGIKVRRGKTWEAFKELHSNKTILTQKQSKLLQRFRRSDTYNNLQPYFQNGVAEQSLFVRNEKFNVILKCRPDFFNKDLNLIVDLKTAATANPYRFSFQAIDFGYHIQDAFYSYLYGCDDFVFIVIEKEPPFPAIFPVVMDNEAKRLGKLLFIQALHNIHFSKTNDHWPSYDTNTITIGLSNAKKNQLECLELGKNYDI